MSTLGLASSVSMTHIVQCEGIACLCLTAGSVSRVALMASCSLDIAVGLMLSKRIQVLMMHSNHDLAR